MTAKGVNGAWTSLHRFFARPRAFVMSVQAESLLEDFFVSAVGSVLALRLYLQVTGFPQLAIGPLHIAHLLWGGLGMLAALIMLLTFLDRSARVTAAVLGGIGFGAFIDELGKFITRDSNYFFEPAVAVIYVVFVLMFFAIRALARRRSLSTEECLANAFDIARQGSLGGLDQEERAHALELLDRCPADPVRHNLEAIFRSTEVIPPRPCRLLDRFHTALDILYRWVAPRWWFSAFVITFFAFAAVTSLYGVVAVLEWSWGLTLWVTAGAAILVALIWSWRPRRHWLGILGLVGIIVSSILVSWAIMGNLKGLPLSILDWAKFIFPGTSGILIAAGILNLPRSRLQAYRMFRRAILVSIFLTQVLAFYEQQLLAVIGLIPDILILIALRYLISHEEMEGKGQPA